MVDLEKKKRLLPQFKLMRNHVSCDVTASEPDHRSAHQTAVPHDLNRIHNYVQSGTLIPGANYTLTCTVRHSDSGSEYQSLTGTAHRFCSRNDLKSRIRIRNKSFRIHGPEFGIFNPLLLLSTW
jgi:hypothetical protein